METQRDIHARHNRVLGQYLMVQCWIHQLDCLVIDREQLQEFFGQQTIRGEHLSWFYADLKPWFPYHDEIVFNQAQWRFLPASIFISRLPLEGYMPQGSMADSDRAKEISHNGLETATLKEILPGGRLPSIDNMLLELAAINAGASHPAPLKKRRRKRKVKKSKIV